MGEAGKWAAGLAPGWPYLISQAPPASVICF